MGVRATRRQTYVLHEGRVVESGTHERLMAMGGRYAEMFNLQAAAFLEAPPEEARPTKR